MTAKEELTARMGGETMTTNAKDIEGLSYVVDTLSGKIDELMANDETRGIKTQYATPAQLGRMFGVNRSTMCGKLNRLVDAGLLKAVRLDTKDVKPHPLYNIADVVALGEKLALEYKEEENESVC